MRATIDLKFADSTAALGFIVTLALGILSSGPGLAQEPGDSIFRLLTFEVAGSGPRLGTTNGDGNQDIVDVHNAITYLYRSGSQEIQTLPAIPIDMRSLIEAGDVPINGVRSLHETMTRMREAGNFEEPGGAQRVFHPPTSVEYLPPVPNPSKVLSLAGAYQRRRSDGTPGNYDLAEYPSFFFKSPASLTGHETDINLWGLLTTGVHEPEFAIVIGRTDCFCFQDSPRRACVRGHGLRGRFHDDERRELTRPPPGPARNARGIHGKVPRHVHTTGTLPHT